MLHLLFIELLGCLAIIGVITKWHKQLCGSNVQLCTINAELTHTEHIPLVVQVINKCSCKAACAESCKYCKRVHFLFSSCLCLHWSTLPARSNRGNFTCSLLNVTEVDDKGSSAHQQLPCLAALSLLLGHLDVLSHSSKRVVISNYNIKYQRFWGFLWFWPCNSEKEKFSMFAHGNARVILSCFLVYLL